MTDIAPIIAGVAGVTVALITGAFAWITKGTEVGGPGAIASGFTSLVGDLRTEIERLNGRVDALESHRKDDAKHIAALEIQIDWLLHRLPESDRDEFNALFRPYK